MIVQIPIILNCNIGRQSKIISIGSPSKSQIHSKTNIRQEINRINTWHLPMKGISTQWSKHTRRFGQIILRYVHIYVYTIWILIVIQPFVCGTYYARASWDCWSWVWLCCIVGVSVAVVVAGLLDCYLAGGSDWERIMAIRAKNRTYLCAIIIYYEK